MKKVGILTLHGYTNYGNKLQNYALQKTLQKLFCEVVTIKNERLNCKSKFDLIKHKLKCVCKSLLFYRVENRRIKVFKKFAIDYLKESEFLLNNYYVPLNLNQEFDYFITGSDQVWNPYLQRNTTFMLLDFAEDKKRISYAASISTSLIPDNLIETYERNLKKFSHISVREEEAKNSLESQFNIQSEVLIDPTLLLSASEWLDVAKKSKYAVEDKYICIYFLSKRQDKDMQEIYNFAEEQNYKIIDLYNKQNKEYVSGPSEFIDFIANSECVYTDSFHATVFSIIFHKPFLVYERNVIGETMFSRITTLLSMFNLNNRIYTEKFEFADILNIDYSNSNIVIDKEKDKALEFLKKALNISIG